MDLRSPFCAVISLGAAASGPVRLFTPYKRRRRNQPSVEQTPNCVQAKQKKTAEEEIDHDHSGVVSGVGVGVSVGVSVGGGGGGGGSGSGGGGIITKEETTWESITDGIDGTNEYIDTASQSEFFELSNSFQQSTGHFQLFCNVSRICNSSG